ncbi:MAG: AAA family ATPase [Proteobacteria bacterium]|jgi:MoxR-like ATPase|nr:AAA family ATPase [Pseudomonadota bacterium]
MSIYLEKIQGTITEAKKLIYGQDELLESILAALVCEGHVLIEGLPGLGKTMSVSVMSQLCDLKFNRIQFTPDLLPSDLIGTLVFNQVTQEFTTKFGPIFSQIILADEINRSPAKVQSALLEAMAEKQVTIGDKTHKLPTPFVVLATQNPIEQEGTFTLPEAQLDRFMIKVSVGYPSFESEKEILDFKVNTTRLQPLLNQAELLVIKQEVEKVYVDEKIKDLIVRIVHSTRPGNRWFEKKREGLILAGASPRATIWIYKLAKFKAFIDNKNFVTPDHVLSVVSSVLGHRVIPSYEAALDKINMNSVVKEIAISAM